MPSINDVAKEAGVSSATVSRTFNAPDLLSEQTHLRVMEAARRLNYLPNIVRLQNRLSLSKSNMPAGRSLVSKGPQRFIGFQFFSSCETDLLHANTIYAPMVAGAQAEAAALGIHLLLHTTNRSSMRLELPKMVRDHTVAGILLAGSADPEVLKEFREHASQIVLVDNRDVTAKYDCIVSDGFTGVMKAASHLFELGHERIGYMMTDPLAGNFQDRLHGFVCAHFNVGRLVDPSLVLRIQPGDDQMARTAEFLRQPKRPTAMIASDGAGAFHVLHACRELNIQVPNELSVIGFDDLDLSSQTWPPLTTIHINKELMGRLGVSRLCTRLAAEEKSLNASPAVTIEVPASLIVRQSSTRPSV